MERNPELDSSELRELRDLVRAIARASWRRRGPRLDVPRRLGRRAVIVLVHIAAAGPQTVGEIAQELGLSLPAVSKIARDLEDESLVRRSEDVDDRRRTVVSLDERTAGDVRDWLGARDQPLEEALGTLTAAERAAFLKGLRALAAALGDEGMRESEHGSLRPDDRPPHRRRAHRHRPL